MNHISSALPATRQHPCKCGTVITQTQSSIGGWWLPLHCAACDAKAQAAYAERLAQEKREGEERQRLARIDRAIRALEVPPKYADAALGTFRLHGDRENRDAQGRVLQIARRYMGNWPDVEPILVFRGAPGTGKGHIAWSIAHELVRAHGAMTQVVKLADLVRRLRATWRHKGETEDEVLDFYRRQEFLVLDEVSTHAFYGQNVHQHLYDVLDHRAEYNRPTILTSNETDEGLQAILRPALWDRLFDGGGILDFGTASWRSRVMEAA